MLYRAKRTYRVGHRLFDLKTSILRVDMKRFDHDLDQEEAREGRAAVAAPSHCTEHLRARSA